MAGKRESLRNGEAVELKPGLRGRLNFNDKTLELSNGTVLPISDADKRELFPADESTRKLAQSKEAIEANIKKTPGGEFFHQLGQSGGIGGIKDWADRFLLNRESYQRRKQAEREVSNRISEESPLASGAATAASFIPDLYLTRGMSAAKAAPLLTGLSAGSRVLDEPLNVAAEAGVAGAGGFLFDKATNFLSKIAARRGASRAIPGQQAAVREQNALGAAEVAAQNAEQKQAFNALSQRVENENAARMHQYNLSLADRENKMIQAKNSYEKARTDREAEVFRLKNEYETAKIQRSAESTRLKNEYETAKAAAQQEEKILNEQYQLAQRQYKEALKDMPRLQKEAQKQYGEEVVKNADRMQKSFPKDTKIYSSQIDPNAFIESAINKGGLLGSREGSQATRIIKGLFPEGESFSAKELSSRYKSIEEAIQRASPEVQGVLTEFKEYLGSRIPVIIEDSVSYNKVMPLLTRYLEKDVINTLKGIRGLDERVVSAIRQNVSSAIKSIDSNGFSQSMKNGELTKKLVDQIAPYESFLQGFSKSDIAKMSSGKNAEYAIAYKNILENAKKTQQALMEGLSHQLENKLARYEIKAMQKGQDVNSRLSEGIRKTYGMAENVPEPVAPALPASVAHPSPPAELPPISPPSIPNGVPAYETLPVPSKPSMMAMPSAPSPAQFTPQVEPTLAPAQGIADKMGDFLEKPLLQGKGNLNNFTKLGLLKYALGPAALPVEAGALGAYGALKGLTAPGAEAARLTFRQAGVGAIEALAQKYPSYHDGIIENPQERRSLTKEIEDMNDIPLGQKAILQSKVNRGKPLSERLY